MDRLFQIVQGCYRHKRNSQRLLYERYYGYALSISFRYMDSYEEARQFTNDIFLDILRNFGHFRYDHESKIEFLLSGWIKTKMIEAIIHDLKGRTDLFRPCYVPHPFLRDRHPLFPETPALYGELITTVRELPPVLRAVFNLHVIDRQPQSEIAKIFGISPKTIASYIQIARQLCIKPFLPSKNNSGDLRSPNLTGKE